jgi:hypothetical protein
MTTDSPSISVMDSITQTSLLVSMAVAAATRTASVLLHRGYAHFQAVLTAAKQQQNDSRFQVEVE